MNAQDIIALLAAKHAEDVFVPECKDGPSQALIGHSRLDAWVMPRSWAHPSLIGYEVKISRGDFIRDDKWRNYLPLCNQLYFATLPGIVKPNELPTEVGLIETSKTGSRLFTRKKAPFREIEEPTTLYRYVLMCRTKVKDEYTVRDDKGYWESWLKDAKYENALGHRVSKKIREVINREIDEVQSENRVLKSQMEKYEAHKALLANLGLSEHESEWRFESKITALLKGINPEDVRAIEKVAELMPVIAKKLKEVARTPQCRRRWING